MLTERLRSTYLPYYKYVTSPNQQSAERSLRSVPLSSTFIILRRWPLRPRASHSVVNGSLRLKVRHAFLNLSALHASPRKSKRLCTTTERPVTSNDRNNVSQPYRQILETLSAKESITFHISASGQV